MLAITGYQRAARVAGILVNLCALSKARSARRFWGAFGLNAVCDPRRSIESGLARQTVENNEHRTKVTILTGTYRVKGSIELVQGARITDYLVEAKEFIAVTDAEVRDLNDRHIFNAPFLNVSRKHIQVVSPQ